MTRSDTGVWWASGFYPIENRSHYLEIDWQAANRKGANDGHLRLWVNGEQKANLTGIDNDANRIERVMLGAIAGLSSSTSGSQYFNAFESNRGHRNRAVRD